MSGGGKGGGGSVVVGFKYYFGIFMGLCRGPVDEIVAAKVADSMAWQGSVKNSGSFSINMPDLFGGEKKEGGIVGAVSVMMGESTQLVDGLPVASILTPGAIPGFRRMCTIFFDGQIAALNPYPKKWSWRVRRATKGWDGDPFMPELAVIQLGAAEPPPAIPVGGNGGGGGVPDVYDPPIRMVAQEGESAEEHAQHKATYDAWYASLPGIKPPYDPDQGHVLYQAGETEDQYIARLTAYNSQFPDPAIKVYYKDNPDVGGIAFIAINVAGNYNGGVDPNAPSVPVEALVSNGQIMAMNPAHIIYECFTNREWGRGLDRGVLNTESFQVAAAKLLTEGFGLCLKWSRKSDIESFIQSIVDHIGAAIYPERDTGLLTLKLIRGDYDAGALPLFTTINGILEIQDATSSTSSAAVNEVQVTYRDPVTNEDRIVKAQNLAAIQSSGGAINTLSKNYPGLPTNSLARRVAQRDLRAHVDGLRKFKVVMDRRGWKLVPGGVFRLRDEARRIPTMVVRVATIEEGTLNNGQITLTVVEDVFSLPETTFTESEPPKWTPPNFNACVGRLETFEVPYFMLNRRLSPAEFAALDNNSAYFGVVAEQGRPTNTNYDLAVKLGEVDDITEQPATDTAICGYGV